MKTETQHTPGPWQCVELTGLYRYDIISVNPEPDCVALVYATSTEGQGKANAELIASAPTLKAQRDELLAALEAMIQATNELAVSLTPEHIADSTVNLTKLAYEARAAIAACKASGKDGGK